MSPETLVVSPVLLAEKEALDDYAILYQFYKFPEGEEKTAIVSFIVEHSFLLSLLLEAYKHIYRIFGRGVKLQLELNRDPEENFDELFIVIKSSYSAEEAQERLNKLDQVWFLNILNKVQGKLNITEEPL
jgi:hypothetical protein